MQVQVPTVFWQIADKLIIGSIVTALGALLVSPFKKAKKEWTSLKADIEKAQKELVHQRTNCLTTLQDQGNAQIALLEKAVTTLEAMHLDQKETLGIIRTRRF